MPPSLPSSPVGSRPPSSGMISSCMSILPRTLVRIPFGEQLMQPLPGGEISPACQVGRHALDLADLGVTQLMPEAEDERLSQVFRQLPEGLVGRLAELPVQQGAVDRSGPVLHQRED